MQKNNIPELLTKLEESQRDKQQLKKSIEELNDCYQSKINILQNTIQAYENRLEQLLEWKKNQINRELSLVNRFEEENKKLLGIIDQLYLQFNKEKEQLEEQVRIKDELIQKERSEKEELIAKSLESEQRIDQLVKEHTKEIDQLKSELVQLKEEIVEGNLQQSKEIYAFFKPSSMPRSLGQEDSQGAENQSRENQPLKQIKPNTNESMKKQQPNQKQLTYRSPSNYLVKI